MVVSPRWFICVIYLCLGNDGKLFTGVNYNLYQAPSGFCFDVLCDDQPIIDDSHSRDFNVEQRVTYCSTFLYIYLHFSTQGMYLNKELD